MAWILPAYVDRRRLLAGVVVAVLTFGVLGTVTALWENPFFFRMTPASGAEVLLLLAQSVLVGFYIVIRRPACSSKGVTAGSVASFLGLACPVCNKVLLFIFGSELLLTYFEPVRVYVAAAGVALTLTLVVWEWRRMRSLFVEKMNMAT